MKKFPALLYKEYEQQAEQSRQEKRNITGKRENK